MYFIKVALISLLAVLISSLATAHTVSAADLTGTWTTSDSTVAAMLKVIEGDDGRFTGQLTVAGFSKVPGVAFLAGTQTVVLSIEGVRKDEMIIGNATYPDQRQERFSGAFHETSVHLGIAGDIDLTRGKESDFKEAVAQIEQHRKEVVAKSIAEEAAARKKEQEQAAEQAAADERTCAEIKAKPGLTVADAERSLKLSCLPNEVKGRVERGLMAFNECRELKKQQKSCESWRYALIQAAGLCEMQGTICNIKLK